MSQIFQLSALRKNFKRFLATLFFIVIPRFRPRIKDPVVGINLIGYSRGDLGLGESLRYISRALKKIGLPFIVRSFQVNLKTSQNNLSLEGFEASFCQYPINLITINPDMIYQIPLKIRYTEWARRYNIANWFWELENFPQEWRYSIPLIDEVWVNTEFLAHAMRQAHPKVIKIPFAVEFEMPSVHFTKRYFNLPENSFIFLCTFDFQSSLARKNPCASIEAFLAAFSPQDHNIFLVIKSLNAHLHSSMLHQLKLLAKNDPRVLFMDRQLSSTEMHGLLHIADCYISLHRSEGVGLGMAESMFLGKPVIATAYSGNLEFMNYQNSYLIPYEKIAVAEGEYPHAKNQVWANPSIKDAAEAMQKIFSNFEFRFNLGKNAREYMLEHHSFSVMGAAIKNRLEEIKVLTLQ